MPEGKSHIDQLSDHLFRHEAGKMVAVLTRIFGTANLELAEDVVQDTLLQALQTWKLKGIPDNPAAWLCRVAKNKAIDVIRRNKHSIRLDVNETEKALLHSGYTRHTVMDQYWQEELIKDDQLRMMFACCNPGISQENQLTLILKTLCGFSTAEIAKTFLTSEDTISKRLYRTREFFREHTVKLEIPSVEELTPRTGSVLNAIYLLFNEGYNSTHSGKLIRQELIEEAMMLCSLLTDNEHTSIPEAFALMALMCFHSARSESRLTTEGAIILLPFQDRSKWNAEYIRLGNDYMNRAAVGETVSTYHLEAAIAYEHCVAERFDQTNWERILHYYNWLCRVSDSPVSEMNRVVAVLQVNGPEEALQALETISGKKALEGFYLYHSLKGEVYSRLNDLVCARECFETASRLTQSVTERTMLQEKIIALFN